MTRFSDPDASFALAEPSTPPLMGSLLLACLSGLAVGGMVALAGHGLHIAALSSWLTAVAMVVAVPVALTLLRRPAQDAAVTASDLAAWDADLEEEIEARRAARDVA
ncbi:hypothetical protein P2H44_08255 [Albimonas sp. CAU 1670]|uniref:hypothetical protein n=1 Tax=Albimonas sp. CAU 1670 TaxID=3032599 RepID=UPI0023DCD165|nr:hypothetical protein [Albimonas sp. CAU 1670]MDF2232540.1 hypothetical protein [Albimonas sp. CAU 1670]